MKTNFLLTLLFFLLCTTRSFAQKDSFKTILVTAGKDSTFNKVIDYLLDNDMFVESVDKQVGFIKAKMFIKDRKILGAKLGERRTFSFILRPAGNKTNVTLNIYSEDYIAGGQPSSRSHYYEDKGILDKPAIYQDVLGKLQKMINP